MSIHRRSAWAFALIAAVVAVAPARAGNLVNIDARLHGYAEAGDPIPNIGQAITPISDAPAGALNQLTLPAGLYKITNAAGEAGALFDAFQFSQDPTAINWTWNFLISNASAGDKTVLFGGRDTGLAATQAEAAASAAGYEAYFAIQSTSTLNFMIRDSYLADNDGGVSLRITWIADLNTPVVPEPATALMAALGAILPAAMLARRRRAS